MIANRFALTAGVTDVSLTVRNHTLVKPVLYINVVAQLDFQLWNNSQNDLFLQKGTASSTLTIYFPLVYFTAAQLQNMKISVPDWTFAYSAEDGSFSLTYSGTDGTAWNAGTSINFSITNVLSTASANSKNVQINIENIANTPASVQATLSLIKQPSGNPKLSDTLQISLDNQGAVFVSSENGDLIDALPNTLMLNLKNSGPDSLYQGKDLWTGTPQVVVTFVYGSTSGSLAPDNDKNKPGLGSAWNIVTALPVAQSPWGFKNPSHTGQAPDPSWTLFPVANNKPILGTGDKANVTFSFSPVVSFTPVGHTQITLLFTGFKQTETIAYEDEIFVLDINKQDPPPTRGLLNFSSINPVIAIDQVTQKITIPLRWGMFDVAGIQLFCSYPGTPPYTKNYPIDAVPSTYPLGYDSYTVSLPIVAESTAVFFTLQAFDGLGGFLNSLQFTVFLDLKIFVDSRDGTVYPIIQVGTQLWMAANLQFASGIFYNNDPKFNVPYGRLYSVKQWKNPPAPAGWRVPTTDDWNHLVAAFTPTGDAPSAYQALIQGGSSGFNAQLGGYYDSSNVGQFQGLGTRGYYWTSSAKDPDDMFVVVFSSVSGTVTVAATAFPNLNAVSVRYVRDI